MEQRGYVAAATILVPSMKFFLIVLCLRRWAPHHCGDPDPYRTIWADVCGFLKPPGSQRFWKVNKHGAFSTPRQALGLRSSDQSSHHETWLHLQFVDWNNKWSRQARYNGTIRLKERPQKRHISDHSLSS